jgi:hypothetical protein
MGNCEGTEKYLEGEGADCLGYETLWLGGWNTLEARSQWMSEQSLPRL